MLKQTLLAMCLAATLVPATFAQAPAPAAGSAPDPCMKMVFDLADLAEQQQLPDASLEKIDGMFNELEGLCKAQDMPKAQAAADKIKAFIQAEK